MSIQPGYTIEEITALVLEYERQPWGTKAAWAHDRGLSQERLRRWRRMVFDGNLRRGLIPREGTPMSTPRERRAIAHELANPYEEIERLREQNRRLEDMNDALGKAIGLLQHMRDQEPAPTTQNESGSTPPRQS